MRDDEVQRPADGVLLLVPFHQVFVILEHSLIHCCDAIISGLFDCDPLHPLVSTTEASTNSESENVIRVPIEIGDLNGDPHFGLFHLWLYLFLVCVRVPVNAVQRFFSLKDSQERSVRTIA